MSVYTLATAVHLDFLIELAKRWGREKGFAQIHAVQPNLVADGCDGGQERE